MEERLSPVASKVLRMFNIFVLFIALRIAENLLFAVSATRPNTRNAIAGVVGTVLFFALLRIRGISNRRIGLSVPIPKMRKSFLLAMIFSAISVFAGYMFDLLSLKLTKNPISFNIYAYNYTYDGTNLKTYLLVLFVCLLISALIAFEYEAVFRGLITLTGRSVLSFAKVNLIQSIFFALFTSVYPVLFATSGQHSFSKFILKYIILYFLHGFILGAAAGLLRRADGSLWLPIFTSFFIFFFTSTIETTSISLPMFEVRRMVSIDIALIVLAFIYYKIRMNKRQKIMEKIKESREQEELEDDEEYEYYDEDEEIEKTVKGFNIKLKDASDKFDELD